MKRIIFYVVIASIIGLSFFMVRDATITGLSTDSAINKQITTSNKIEVFPITKSNI